MKKLNTKMIKNVFPMMFASLFLAFTSCDNIYDALGMGEESEWAVADASTSSSSSSSSSSSNSSSSGSSSSGSSSSGSSSSSSSGSGSSTTTTETAVDYVDVGSQLAASKVTIGGWSATVTWKLKNKLAIATVGATETTAVASAECATGQYVIVYYKTAAAAGATEIEVQYSISTDATTRKSASADKGKTLSDIGVTKDTELKFSFNPNSKYIYCALNGTAKQNNPTWTTTAGELFTFE